MEGQKIFALIFILCVTFRSSFICAENSDESAKNDTVTYKTITAPLPENVTEATDTGQTGELASVSKAQDAAVVTNEYDSREAEIKPSDEIIISNYKDYDGGSLEDATPVTVNGSTPSSKPTTRRRTTSEGTRATDSIIGVRKISTKTLSHSTVFPSIMTELAPARTSEPSSIGSVISATIGKSSLSVVSDASLVTSTKQLSMVPEVDQRSPSVGTTHTLPYVHGEHGTGTDHANKDVVHKIHHIPFRHHLQLVPMEDEPFGAALLKDQRYIVSVLIPVGVGIIGALVIMVTVYGLRHVARKHGREFPRVDIEAGRQNIASISSERTDKMLLLDDDEDNEF